MKLIRQAIRASALVFLLASCHEVKAAERGQYIGASNKSNCKIFAPGDVSGRVEWAGKCKGGFAQGNGFTKWYDSENKLTAESSVWMDAKGFSQGHVKTYVHVGGKKYLNYDGNVKNSQPDGIGRVYFSDGYYIGKLEYDGHLKNGQPGGYGVLHYPSGEYEGDWVNGKRQGHGRFYDSLDRMVYDGGYVDDKRQGYGEETEYSNDNDNSQIFGKLKGEWSGDLARDGDGYFVYFYNNDKSLAYIEKRGEIQDGHLVIYPVDHQEPHIGQTEQSAEKVEDESDDTPQSSTGAQIASGLVQGLARSIGTYQAVRAPVVTARTQASAAVARRAQTNADALALTQQRAASQAQQSANYSQSASQAPHSQDATGCIRVSDNNIHNGCNTTISVVWCVQGDYSSCERGYDNESDVSAGGTITALPLKHPGTAIKVNYAACTGSNTAMAHGWSAKCD